MTMKNLILPFIFFVIIGFISTKEIPKDESIATLTPESLVVENSSTQTTVKEEQTTIIAISSTTEEPIIPESSEESQENILPHVELQPQPQHQRRKVLYLNQQQHGKFNVHLELNDVSLIVIPNKKDPQLSLLNLLLRSAQKSNLKKSENPSKVDTEDSSKIENTHKVSDEYSKYKIDNFMHHPSTNEPFPTVESRVAPYKVEISTIGKTLPVEIIPNANLMARSPSVKILKPLETQNHHIFKRSIDQRFYGLNFDSPVLSDRSISSNDNEEDELTESITNSLENNQKINSIGDADDSFILLGAIENCGPGRKRNSYQICVNDDHY